MNVARMFVSRMERRIHTFVSKLIHSYLAKINPHHILEKTHIKVFLNIFNQIMEAINKTKVFQKKQQNKTCQSNIWKNASRNIVWQYCSKPILKTVKHPKHTLAKLNSIMTTQVARLILDRWHSTLTTYLYVF